jgi:proteasome-associated ATPase
MLMSLKVQAKLLAGKVLDTQEQHEILELVKEGHSEHVLGVVQVLLKQHRRLSADLNKSEHGRTQAEAALAELRSPPWIPGTVLRTSGEGRADVLGGGRRQVVSVVPEASPETLGPGDAVFLDRELSVVVGRDAQAERTGPVGVVAEAINGKVVLRGVADEEVACFCAPSLAASLRPGDRVVYSNEVPFVLDRLPERSDSAHVLEEAPDVTFADIGGLDDVTSQIRRLLDLHLVHGEKVSDFRLRIVGGITLTGPPGVGKTMIAKAVARHLMESGPGARFFHVKPGALRSVWYGDSEKRIRDLFKSARAFPGISVVFFDELDSIGSRRGGLGQDIDGRVLGALLEELDGVQTDGKVLCLGATNRIDLCDDALVRAGRLHDRTFAIPRPARDGTREVLRRYLEPSLPYASNGEKQPEAIIDAVVSLLHSPNAEPLATATLTNGTRREIRPRDVLSGALLASVVEQAKHAAAWRVLDGGDSIVLDDLIDALEDALEGEARKLGAPQAARQILDFPEAGDIARVELSSAHRPRRHRYVRAA